MSDNHQHQLKRGLFTKCLEARHVLITFSWMIPDCQQCFQQQIKASSISNSQWNLQIHSLQKL
eukprot:scaffold279941_cov19-Prasinocladus_malaysianus.AAC.1